MRSPDHSKLHFELVPTEAAASFTFREFEWPHFPFNWHFHPEVELTLIMKGRGVRFVGDSVEAFSDGDLCLIGSNVPHCWASQADAPRGVRSLVIQFLPERWGSEFWATAELTNLNHLLERARHGLLIRGATRRGVRASILEMTRTLPGSWQRVVRLLSILGSLADSTDLLVLSATPVDASKRRGNDPRLARVLGFLQINHTHALSQHDLARQLGLTASAFSHFFRRSTGKTFVDYVNGLRISEVCRALIESERSVTDLAYEAGFNNLSNFNRHFRRLKRMTPRQYRRQARSGAKPASTSARICPTRRQKGPEPFADPRQSAGMPPLHPLGG